MEILNALQIAIPIIKEALNLDAQICLCDREKTIGVWYGKSFKLNISVGTYLDKSHPGDDMVMQVLQTGEGSAGNLPEFIYGVPTNGILTPVKEDGKVIGVISTAVSIANNARMNDYMQSVHGSLENTRTGVQEIVANAEMIVKLLEQVQGLSNDMEILLNETTGVVSGIQSASKKSNIIALNATIEAARVGEEGKGFAVVAKEMGNLSKNNGESAKKITEQIQQIFTAMQQMTTQFTDILEAATNQVATTQEMTSSIAEIAQDAEVLADICKKNLE